ncbi:Rieske (2Fe-2S) protein [Pseudonocardia ailaonensis]|uniref:Rieske (2Fe-2S) protein n=1 Tax=Pseudonocardia ailaonensis TaxID=367279 RepID=A0ABN2N5X3_9PSEU
MARVSDIPVGKHRLVQVGGRAIGIYNVGGTFRALADRCPHQGASLCGGEVVSSIEADAPGEFRFDPNRKFVTCPWHGWEFELETGQSWFDPELTRARRFNVAVEHGEQIVSALHGDPAQGRVRGPYVAEVVQVDTDDDYVVVTTPR